MYLVRRQYRFASFMQPGQAILRGLYHFVVQDLISRRLALFTTSLPMHLLAGGLICCGSWGCWWGCSGRPYDCLMQCARAENCTLMEGQALRDFITRRLIVVIAEGFIIMIHSRHVPILAAARVEVGIDVDIIIIIIIIVIGIVSSKRHVHVFRW